MGHISFKKCVFKQICAKFQLFNIDRIFSQKNQFLTPKLSKKSVPTTLLLTKNQFRSPYFGKPVRHIPIQKIFEYPPG
jgi:hypothetical protein